MERELSRLVVSSRKACLGVNKPKFSSRLETFFVSSRKILENGLKFSKNLEISFQIWSEKIKNFF